jgi:hypothetical protein
MIAALLLAGRSRALYPSARPSATRAVANPGTLRKMEVEGLLSRHLVDGSPEFRITKIGHMVYLGLLKQAKARNTNGG